MIFAAALADIVNVLCLQSSVELNLEPSISMVNRVSFHAAQRRGVAGFSPACLFATYVSSVSAIRFCAEG
jgi:hypothetical protein